MELKIACVIKPNMDYSLGIEQKLLAIEEAIISASKGSDIIVTPEYTYFFEEMPSIMDKGIAGPFASHIDTLQAISNKDGKHFFLGTFREVIVQHYSVFLSNTALYLSPFSPVQKIRKICGSDSFKYVSKQNWDKFVQGSMSLSNAWKESGYHEGYYTQDPGVKQAADELIRASIKSRMKIIGVSVLPLICAEASEGARHFEGLDAKIVINMAADGDLPAFDIGRVHNLGFKTDRFGVNFDKGRDYMLSELKGVLNIDGVYAHCDFTGEIGIYYPFSERALHNYMISPQFVSGTVSI